jgi:cell division protein FtsL
MENKNNNEVKNAKKSHKTEHIQLLKQQNKHLKTIENWLTFFGILTILTMIAIALYVNK